jgi:hypothetical protein
MGNSISEYKEEYSMSMYTPTKVRPAKELWKTIGCSMAVAVMLACSAMSASASNSLSCYKGDKDNSILIGEIADADLKEAADACNTTYGDCNGECYGCYLDENLSGEICVDSDGRTFTR